MRLSDAERKIMELVWTEEGITATEISRRLAQEIGWKKTTAYTMVSICIQKGYLRKENPQYRCYSRISRQQVVDCEVNALISSSYNNMPDLLVASLVSSKKISPSQLARINEVIRKLEEEK